MSREILQDIIDGFLPDKFTRFFREKNRSFTPRKEDFDQYNDENFSNGLKLGEINFAQNEQTLICFFKASKALSERSGKKAQYEKGKKILKDQQSEAGIFVFYDAEINFRFSLIYTNYLGKRRDWSFFRRFTYFVSREYTNRTFLKRIGDGDFSSLENIKEAFSVEAVNKEFYRNVAKYFNQLVGGEVQEGAKVTKYKRMLNLPSVGEEDKESYQEFSVRLIGRVIFCWFLKHKKSQNGLPLVTSELLSSNAVKANSSYYHAVLENLFFEVLNTRQDERKKAILKGEEQIPFLNGGLFEPHDGDFYLDKPAYNLSIPDKWFFDFFEMLEQYNFTIDENTTVDVDISVDPEMLGRIFENLLAEINPETGETARKNTGSYYTPREIVEYMVDEGLKRYLMTTVKIDEKIISSLISYGEEEIILTEREKNLIIDALDKLKIIDPACGSGAFPMGILHKMLLILQRIDPQSKKWFAKKIEKVEGDILRKDMEEELKNKNWEYVHKLGIIQSSIFGVDIQTIAVEISKLRVFLSLIVDERIEDEKPNRGVEPLPNLEFKFVCANSLVGLPAKKNDDLLFSLEDHKSIHKLKELRSEYFISQGAKKNRIERDLLETQKQMLMHSLKYLLRPQRNLYGHEKNVKEQDEPLMTKMLSQWNPFSIESCPWFDPEWMFGVQDGFDIVIANPPYGNLLEEEQRKVMIYEYKYSTLSDISSPFIERSFNLLKNTGNLVFIITFAITFSKDFSKSRGLIANNFEESFVYSFDRDKCRIFESMSQSVSIIKCFNKNSAEKKGIFSSRFFRNTPDILATKVCNCDKFLLPKLAVYSEEHRLPKIGESLNKEILIKLLGFENKVKSIIVKSGTEIWIRTSGNYWYNAFDRKPYKSVEISPINVNENFSNFIILLMNSSLFYFWFRIYGDGRHMNRDIFESFPLPLNEKIEKYCILLEKMKNKFMLALFSVFEQERNRFITSEIKSDIDMLDLVLGKYFYDLSYKEIVHILNYDLEIRGGNKLNSGIFEKIDAIIKTDNAGKVKEYERQIDQMVYKLYDLSQEEIKIVENLREKE